MTDNSIVIGDIASFSSYEVLGAGPSGKALPDICAPGTLVVAAANRYSYLANSTNTVMMYDNSYWGVMSGTSMAAPTVAGIIALWLQVNPRLCVSQVKEIIANTAIRDRYTSGEHRDQFGPNGKINALEGMLVVLKSLKPLKGDVNNDGNLNIMDVTALINYLLDDGESINLPAADVNSDGEINITDLTALIHLLLNRL